jgi:transcription elongation factor Elf1
MDIAKRSSRTEETTISSRNLPRDLNCVKCGRSIREVGGYVVSLAEVIRRETKCTALCDSCGNPEAA